MLSDTIFTLGACSAITAIAMGGARAHLLGQRLPRERLAMIEVGMRYQVAHSIALMVVSLAMPRYGSAGPLVAAAAFACGIVLFSGAMYVHALTGSRLPLRLTPLAGGVLLVGWGALAVSPWLA